MDIASLQAAWTGLSAAGTIAKGLVNLNTMAEVQAKAIELNDKIIAAQNSMFAAQATQAELIANISELEKELVRVKAWERQKQRYKLISPWPGRAVYALKESMSEGEPPHWICANCYENGKRSILQARHQRGQWASIECQSCMSQITSPNRSAEEPQYAPGD
jgi:hypothetical protein